MIAAASRPHVVLRLSLPLPPGVNNQYVTVGRHRILSKAARTFRRDVVKLVERARTGGSVSPATESAIRNGLLGIYLDFYFETPMRRDLDGGLKIALDALAEALGFDDRAIVDLHLTKRLDPLHPRLELEIETIHDWQFDRQYVYLGDPEPNGSPGVTAGSPTAD
jgi:crossover junction endodeoxyribonuclease RusA